MVLALLESVYVVTAAVVAFLVGRSTVAKPSRSRTTASTTASEAIRTFVVKIVPGRGLTEAGYERLDEGVDAADLPGAIHDAVVEALLPELPQDVDWYNITVAEMEDSHAAR